MDYTFDICLKTRKIFCHFLETLTLEQLNYQPDNFKNTIYWNIKHIVVTQQLLVYGLSNIPMLVKEEEITAYRKGTSYEKDATLADVEQLKDELFTTLDQTIIDYKNGLFKTYNEYEVSTKSVLSHVDEALQFNNFHEGIHLGYVFAMLKSIPN